MIEIFKHPIFNGIQLQRSNFVKLPLGEDGIHNKYGCLENNEQVDMYVNNNMVKMQFKYKEKIWRVCSLTHETLDLFKKENSIKIKSKSMITICNEPTLNGVILESKKFVDLPVGSDNIHEKYGSLDTLRPIDMYIKSNMQNKIKIEFIYGEKIWRVCTSNYRVMDSFKEENLISDTGEYDNIVKVKTEYNSDHDVSDISFAACVNLGIFSIRHIPGVTKVRVTFIKDADTIEGVCQINSALLMEQSRPPFRLPNNSNFSMHAKINMRLMGVDFAEHNTAEGQYGIKRVKETIERNDYVVYIKTVDRAEMYGRTLSYLFLDESCNDSSCINTMFFNETYNGNPFVEPYDGGTKSNKFKNYTKIPNVKTMPVNADKFKSKQSTLDNCCSSTKSDDEIMAEYNSHIVNIVNKSENYSIINSSNCDDDTYL
jgi:hypothetical protein